jgi:DNA-binding CsgD family transcriptional regulator
MHRPDISARRLHGDLTPRENQVLILLIQGLTNKLIADRLSLSEHSVKFHMNGILAKLGAANRTEAVSIAMRRGLTQTKMTIQQQLQGLIEALRLATTNKTYTTQVISPELANEVLNYISGANHKPVTVGPYPNQMTGDDDIGA